MRRKSKEYVIYKYRPEYYGEDGYTLNEWTDFCDIGKTFYDGILTKEEYLKWENRYLSALRDIAEACGCQFLTIRYLSVFPKSLKTDLKKSPFSEDACLGLPYFLSLHEEQRLTLGNAIEVFRFGMRNYIDVSLANRSHLFRCYMGNEFYLHLFIPLTESTISEISERYHLHYGRRFI